MKTGRKFSFEELLAYPPLNDRGYDLQGPQLVLRGGEKRYLVQDAAGNMIPDGPGKVRPLTSLPTGHPAIQYVLSRGFDPYLLRKQFRVDWCDEEAPEGEEYNRFYRRHPFGWVSTPQSRIIFYCDVGGVQVCWQGRYLEMDGHDGTPLVFHPYRRQWEIRPEWQKGEDPVKYNTAPGAFRNCQLCGYDAVVAASKARREEPMCVLTEGPMDAARFPEHGLGVLGKHMSDSQALLVAANFRKAVLAFDADEYGFKACTQAAETLARFGVRTRNFFTEEDGLDGDGKPVKMDPGKLSYEEAAARLQRISEF